MERKLWETIVKQCAPVLADVKPSNLLILAWEEQDGFAEAELPEGIEALALSRGERKAIWFLYRRDRLEAELIWPQTRTFLQDFGYRAGEEGLIAMLFRLRERYAAYKEGKAAFPHEMGVFLGYPLCDVKGFIEQGGRNCLLSGYWKVYGNVGKAKKTFQTYRTVRDVLLRLLSMEEVPREAELSA
ncbi:MAG: DUF3793 family protein [Lachnospiraceae bacterium]|nr:DUF3793 family protein [Lachnospiraceae bacterium]